MTILTITCPDCGKTAQYTPSKGECSCQDCGLVMEQLSEHPEFREYCRKEEAELDAYLKRHDPERWDGLS